MTERWIELGRRLPDVLAGTHRPAPVEALELAELCRQPFNRRYDLAVHLYRTAFAAEPKLLTGDAAYSAACAAVQLAAGNDPAARLGVDEWHLLQHRARAWLAADLASAAKLATSGAPSDRDSVRRKLAGWQRSRELLPTRDPAALAAMPADERAAWEKLWRDVATAIEATRPPVAPAPREVK